MSDIKLPLAFSVVGHAIGVALLILLLKQAPPVPQPIAKGGIEVVFAPPPAPEPPPVIMPAVEPVETPPPEPPPPPQPPVAVTEPPPPAPEAPVTPPEPPPPPPAPPKPAVKKPPRPVLPNRQTPRPTQAETPPVPNRPAAQAPPAPLAPPQTAMAPTRVPAPVPSPEAAAGYRALLSAWLESHKRYPESARERGEEGHAVLRFVVDRSGRVLDYAVTSSSGYPDLDQSVEEMMRGATLPPFPAGMPEPRMEVSVTIRFGLRR